MAGYNIDAPRVTRDPGVISAYLSEQYEALRYVLGSIDEDNLSEDILIRLDRIESRLENIERIIQSEE